MRLLGLGLLAVVTACSNNNPTNDAGTDASSGNDSAVKDVTTTDAPSDAVADSGGCGTGSGVVTGSLVGASLQVMDALSGADSNGPLIALASYSGVCAVFEANNNKANSSSLAFFFQSVASISTGTFTVPGQVDAEYASYDATCNSPNGESGTSGSVTITSVDACKVAGTFDVMLNTDHVTGSFTAPRCSPPSADAGQFGCQ